MKELLQIAPSPSLLSSRFSKRELLLPFPTFPDQNPTVQSRRRRDLRPPEPIPVPG
ncbi:hypothetical protein KFK09_004683 [Dendrobium nobile]|uniref:Uncharacterized protein n=1 Tax=Dendrobium nobile TaxID=94219 RepID=A0A8T3C4P6_DENNO|nr:hypothetical protein KFK09_004683 [Dendrobium nobile]